MMIFRNGFLYVANSSLTGQVSRFNANTGAFVNTFVAAGSGGLSNPEGMGSPLQRNHRGVHRLVRGGGKRRLSLAQTACLRSRRQSVCWWFGGGSVLRYNGTTGAFIDQFVPPGSGNLAGPTFLVFNQGGGGPVPETSSTFTLLGMSLATLAYFAKFRKPAI